MKRRMKAFRKGTKVNWKWTGGMVAGRVEEIFTGSVVKVIKGKRVTLHGSQEKPAYLVRSEAGVEALKLQSDLRASKT